MEKFEIAYIAECVQPCMAHDCERRVEALCVSSLLGDESQSEEAVVGAGAESRVELLLPFL